MPSSTAVLLLGTLLAAGSAVPFPRDFPRCSQECPLAGSQKLWYSPEKTYTYHYSTHSRVHMGSAEGDDSQMHWTALVDLTWLGPCDMAITFREPSFDGATGTHEGRSLTRYPMVVAMNDGLVRHVCTHPEDEPWAINLKKGVAAAFQNNLPSNSSVNSGLSFSEVDIIGTCPTKYEVENFDQQVVIHKWKNPQQCQESYSGQRETPMFFMKSPEVQDSLCKCTQEMSKGIYTSITCEDKNVIRPWAESSKYIEAVQRSELKYQSESRDAPEALSGMGGALVRRGLQYEHETTDRDPSKVLELEQVWKQICEKTRHSVEKDTAESLANAISLMRHVPKDAMEQMLWKIKNGEICSNRQKMESLFLDAVAAVHEANTVDLMVREIMSDRRSGGRSFLYTLALYYIHQPSIQSVEAVKPLLEQPHRYPMASLAAASMVNRYCKNRHRCQEDIPVQEAVEALTRSCYHHCSSAGSEEACLSSLKARGNLGVMSSEDAQRMADLIGKEGTPDAIQVAVAHSFRNVKCDCVPTGQLVDIALDPRRRTEARIASYLAAERCAGEGDWRRISDTLSGEENTQARGFILSHMHNLKRSSAPYKERQRSMLSSITVPRNFSSDIRKYSGNMDLFYHPHHHGYGVSMESDVVYAPASFVPRSVHMNFTDSSGGYPYNYGEFGIRTEGFEPKVRDMFGPEGYFKKSSVDQVFMDLLEYIRHRGSHFLQYFQGSHGRRGSADFSDFAAFFTDLFAHRSEKEPRLDLFARFRGQEVAYMTLTRKSLQDAGIGSFPNSFLDVLFRTPESDIDTARTMQVNHEHTFMSCFGIPLKVKKSATLVAGLAMGHWPDSSEGQSATSRKFNPSFSGLIQEYYGFDSSIGSCGCQRDTKISSFSGLSLRHKGGQKFEYEFDFPEKMELLDVNSQTSLTKHTRWHPMTKVSLFETRRPEEQRQHCFQTLEQMSGLKVCYDENILDVLRGDGLSHDWATAGKITAEKSDSSIRGWKIRGEIQNNPDMSAIAIDMETPGSYTPRNINCLFTYARDESSWKMDAGVSSRHHGGYKMELKRRYSGAENNMEFRVHSSSSQHFSPETEVFEALVSSRYDGQTSEVHARSQTKHTLKPYLDHYFEVQGDLRYHPHTGFPLPSRLQMFRTRTAFGDSRFDSSVERTGEGEYSSMLKFGSRSTDTFGIEGKHNFEGSWDEGMSTKTTALARIRGQQYKTAFYTYNWPEKKGVSLKINRHGDGSKICECEALFENSEHSRKAKLLLDVPEHMNPIKFESQLQDHGSHRYHIQVALKHGRHDIFHVDGPVTANSNRDTRHFQADLRVRTMPDNLHKISTLLLWEDNKKHLSFDVRDQHTPKISFDWKKYSEPGEETRGGLRLLLPGYIDHNVDVKSSNRNIMVNLNTVLSQGSSSSRRLKASCDVDFQDMNTKAELYWDADRDPSKRASFEATSLRESPHHTSIHGQCSFCGDTYYYRGEMNHPESDSWLYGKKHINFEVTTPSRRTHHFQTEIDLRQQPQGAKLDASMRYKDPEDNVHQYSETMDFERVRRSSNFRVHSKTTVTCPECHQCSLTFEARHEQNPEEREAFVQLRIENPSMRRPFQTSFTLRHQHSSYKGEWKMDADTPVDVSHYEMRFSPRNRVETLRAGFDMKKINAILKAARNMGRIRPDSQSTEEDAKYLVHYEKPTHSSHKILMYSPARKMEGEFRHSPSECLLRFNPDKDRRDPIYELSFSSQRNSGLGEDQVRYKGRFSHPSLERAREMEVLFTSHEERHHGTGTVWLDIFPRAEDRITGTIETTRPARDAMKIEAKLSGKILKNNPRFIVNTAYTPNTMGIDFLYEKSPGSRPSLSFSGKYDHISGRDAAMNFIVKAEDEPVLEMSGSSRPEQSSECNGREITGVIHSPRMGHYNILSKVCGRTFMSAWVNREGSDKSYICRGGLQGMRNVELSAWERDTETKEIRPIAVAQVKLQSPTVMGIEMNYQHEEAMNLWKSAHEKWSTVSASVRSGIERMRKEAVNEEHSYDSSDMVNLWEETKDEAWKIAHTLPFGSLLPSWETVHHVARHHFVQNFVDFLSRYDHFKRQMNSGMLNLMRHMKQKYETLTSYVDGDALTRGRHMMGSLLVIASRMADNWGVRFPDEYEALRKIVEKLKEEIERAQREGHINPKGLSDQDVLRIWHRVESGEAGYQSADADQEPQYFSLMMKPNHIKAEIPLYQPVSSLAQAGKHVIFRPNLVPEGVLSSYEWLILPFIDLWTNPNYSEANKRVSGLLPPFKKTAMVIDGTEILTFDGAVLRAPHCDCNVLLASYKDNSVFMKASNIYPLPYVNIKTKDATITIEHDGRVTFNGRDITESQFSEGDIKISRTQNEVEVVLPVLTFRFDRVGNTISVEVNPWTFGQVSGLLGSYDGEMANDWNTPRGSRASSLQELVNSWQEDQGCQTPEVEPMNTSHVSPMKILQCNILLGAHTHCNSEVPLDSFMKICHACDDACHAARAYQSLCYKMGSREPLPVTC
nr:vitellogenin 5 [Macrobrachium rosenbergii]